jgi:putative PIN family toxin of toxin-antitoxin system
VLSEHILAELKRTLDEPFFANRLSASIRQQALGKLRYLANTIEIETPVSGIATHPEDDFVLATAISGQVDYLVTGDTQLQRLGHYREVVIASPRAFVNLLENTDEFPTSAE